MKKYLLLIILLLLPGITHTRRFRKKYPPKKPLSAQPVPQTAPETTTPTAPATPTPGPRSCANIPIVVPIPVTGPEISGTAPTTPKETETITPQPVQTETSTEVAPETEPKKPLKSKNTANVAFDYYTLAEIAKKFPDVHVLGIFNDTDVPIKYNIFRSNANQTAVVEVARQFAPSGIAPQKSIASNITAGKGQQSYFYASVPEPLDNQKTVEGFFVLPGLVDIPDGSMAVPTAITIRKEGQACNAYATILLVKFEQNSGKTTSTKILHEILLGPIACEKIQDDQHTQVGVGLMFAPTKKLAEPFDEQEVKPE